METMLDISSIVPFNKIFIFSFFLSNRFFFIAAKTSSKIHSREKYMSQIVKNKEILEKAVKSGANIMDKIMFAQIISTLSISVVFVRNFFARLPLLLEATNITTIQFANMTFETILKSARELLKRQLHATYIILFAAEKKLAWHYQVGIFKLANVPSWR